MKKYFIEENGQKRESSEQEVKNLSNNPDKMITESVDENGNVVVKVLTRLMG